MAECYFHCCYSFFFMDITEVFFFFSLFFLPRIAQTQFRTHRLTICSGIQSRIGQLSTQIIKMKRKKKKKHSKSTIKSNPNSLYISKKIVDLILLPTTVGDARVCPSQKLAFQFAQG